MVAIPTVSIVVCTANRTASLLRTLRSLPLLADPGAGAEVIVVAGPGTDLGVLGSVSYPVQVIATDQRNLSLSRNLGIRASRGDVVAFIDDDAIPDTWWLVDLIGHFSDAETVGAGGATLDHTGARLQARYSFVERTGEVFVRNVGPNPSDLLSVPRSRRIHYPIGTNALFRRNALVSIGGFDEHYDYYLDDAEVALRMIDSGWRIAADERGFVHHLSEPSWVRDRRRVTVDYRSVFQNQRYFGLRNGVEKSEVERVSARLLAGARHSLSVSTPQPNRRAHALQTLEDQWVAAIEAGIEKAQQGPLLKTPEWFGEAGAIDDIGLVASLTEYTTVLRPGTRPSIGNFDERRRVRMIELVRHRPTVQLIDSTWIHRVRWDPNASEPELPGSTQSTVGGSEPDGLQTVRGWNGITSWAQQPTTPRRPSEDSFTSFVAVMARATRGFSAWVLQEASDAGASAIMYCARDGQLPYQAAISRSAATISLEYLYVSRRSLARPAIAVQENTDPLTGLFDGPLDRRVSIADIVTLCGLEPTAASIHLAEVGLRETDIVDSIDLQQRARQFIARAAEGIVDAARPAKRELYAYLANLFAGHQRVVISDLGWHGSFVRLLQMFLDDAGIDCQLFGRFFGTLDLPHEAGREDIRGWVVDDGFPERVAVPLRSAVQVLESVFQAPHGTTIGYRNGAPVLGDYEICPLRQQIHDSVRSSFDSSAEDADPTAGDDLVHLLGQPDPEIHRILARLRHDESWLGLSGVPLGSARSAGAGWPVDGQGR